MARLNDMHCGSTSFTFQKAEELRIRMTKAELVLWQVLSGSRFIGFKFRRQHPVGRFTNDEVLHKTKNTLLKISQYMELLIENYPPLFPPLGLGKRKEEEDFNLYPNPASDNITIEFTNDKFENIDAKLQVYSITGKLIYSTQFNTNSSFKVLSVDDLNNGVYIYHISLSNGIDKSGKLVILKQ